MRRLNSARRTLLLILVGAVPLTFQACSRDAANDDASKASATTASPSSVTEWKEFKASVAPISFEIPRKDTQIAHDNNQMLLVMYIDDLSQIMWAVNRMGPDPEPAKEYVASKIQKETTGSAIVAPPVDYPLKGGKGTYWADKTGNTKRTHRLLFAHSGWIGEVSVKCDGDTLPDSLKRVFDSIALSGAEDSSAKTPEISPAAIR